VLLLLLLLLCCVHLHPLQITVFFLQCTCCYWFIALELLLLLLLQEISANILQGQWVNYYNYCSNRDGGRNKRRGSAIGVQQHGVPSAGLVE
jgi:hypothetical protein